MRTLTQALVEAAAAGLFVAVRRDPKDEAAILLEVWTIPTSGSTAATVNVRRKFSPAEFVADGGALIVEVLDAARATLP